MGLERTARLAARVGALVVGALFCLGAAWAAPADPAAALHMHGVASLSVLGGLLAFATILSLLHLRERARWTGATASRPRRWTHCGAPTTGPRCCSTQSARSS